MYKLQDTGVLRFEDNASIPEDNGNRHWREYQAWLAGGNQPEPEDQPLLEDVRQKALATLK